MFLNHRGYILGVVTKMSLKYFGYATATAAASVGLDSEPCSWLERHVRILSSIAAEVEPVTEPYWTDLARQLGRNFDKCAVRSFVLNADWKADIEHVVGETEW